MKKTVAFAVSVLTVLSTTAFPVNAVDDNRGAVISTTIEPAYTVTIPKDINVPFNAEKTDFGSVSLSSAHLEPNKCVRVSMLSDNTLENKADSTKKIPYTIYEGTSYTIGNVFTQAVYNIEGGSTPLTISITKDDWNKAYAGEYEDTVTFMIEYTDR